MLPAGDEAQGQEEGMYPRPDVTRRITCPAFALLRPSTLDHHHLAVQLIALSQARRRLLIGYALGIGGKSCACTGEEEHFMPLTFPT